MYIFDSSPRYINDLLRFLYVWPCNKLFEKNVSTDFTNLFFFLKTESLYGWFARTLFNFITWEYQIIEKGHHTSSLNTHHKLLYINSFINLWSTINAIDTINCRTHLNRSCGYNVLHMWNRLHEFFLSKFVQSGLCELKCHFPSMLCAKY